MGQPVETLLAAPAFVGLAGVTGPVIAERLRDALPFRHVRVADDRIAGVRGALGRRDGVVAHCGTGSFFASQRGGAIRLSGGWGPVLGDEASAQWVGRTALGLALKAEDGRLAPSSMTARILADFGDAAGVVRFAGTAGPSDLGALAPLVTEYAQSGDTVAELILRQAAEDIADALRHLGWRPGEAVCLTGGIGPNFRRYLADDLRACLSAPEGEPIDGALSLARDFAREVADGHR
jgi:glucosamine kinase